MLDLCVGPQPGRPRIGFQSKESAQRSAAEQQLMAEERSGLESYAVPMPDGTWAYWTAHDEHDPGWLLLPGGRCISGKAWARWESGMVLDARYPTIWTTRTCRRRWDWQVDLYGCLVHSAYPL